MNLRSTERCGLLVCTSLLISGCTGGGVGGSVNPAQQPGTQSATANPQDALVTGTGTLEVKVVDPEGKALAGASVVVTNSAHRHIASQTTNASGNTTFVSIPQVVHISVRHTFGTLSDTYRAAVAPEGRTSLSLALEPRRPQPTVAVLPLSIPPDSISEDRRELTLEVTMVASASASFFVGTQAKVPDVRVQSSVTVSLESGQWCHAYWWNGKSNCRPGSNNIAYTSSNLQTIYDPVGAVPTLSTPGKFGSAMLVLDQSERVSEHDRSTRRSFAARQFIGRLLTQPDPKDLAISGLSGHGSDPGVVSLLPEQPLWALRGAGTVFTQDRVVLNSAVDVLEPLVGGSAPVFDGLEAAMELSAAHAPPGTGAIVAMLGGGDTLDRLPSEHRAALASLRQRRDAAGIQAIVVAGIWPIDEWGGLTLDGVFDQIAIADLSAALRAPTISMGAHSWDGGSFGALDLAADLLSGRPLPSVSSTFRVTSGQPDAFAPGATLNGWIWLIAPETCGGPVGCNRFGIPFAVEVP